MLRFATGSNGNWLCSYFAGDSQHCQRDRWGRSWSNNCIAGHPHQRHGGWVPLLCRCACSGQVSTQRFSSQWHSQFRTAAWRPASISANAKSTISNWPRSFRLANTIAIRTIGISWRSALSFWLRWQCILKLGFWCLAKRPPTFWDVSILFLRSIQGAIERLPRTTNVSDVHVLWSWNAVKTTQKEGFHLDIEDYLMGLLQLASELVHIK